MQKNIFEIDNRLLKFVENNFKIKNKKIDLVGSSMLRNIRFFADYDFVSNIYNKKIGFSDVVPLIKNFDQETFYFLELKLQYPDEKIKIGPSDKLHEEYFTDELDFIKIDFAYYDGHIFKECSIMYRLKKTDDRNDIKKDMLEQIKEGKYYKATKRLFSLKKNYKTLEQRIVPLFNSELGLLYVQTENLDLLLRLRKLYKNPKIKLKITDNILKLGYKPRQDLKKQIEKNKKIYNEGALEYLQENKLEKYVGGFGTASKNPENIELDQKIVDVTVCLKNLSKESQKRVESFLGHTHLKEFGTLYHSFMNVKLQSGEVITLEKGDSPYLIIAKEKYRGDRDNNCIRLGAPRIPMTLKELLDLTEKRIGSKFHSYDPLLNNCQHMTSNLLHTMGISGKPIHNFIVRDVSKLFKGKNIQLNAGRAFLGMRKFLQKWRVI